MRKREKRRTQGFGGNGFQEMSLGQGGHLENYQDSSGQRQKSPKQRQ